MSVAVPQVRMEIFRGPPKLIDDNFVKGWTFNAVGSDGLSGYSFITDGDIVTINSGSGGLAGAWVQYVKAVSGSTNVYTKAIVRAKRNSLNGKWALIVHYTDGTNDQTGWRDDATFQIITLSLTAGKTIDYIYIHCQTTDGNAAQAQYDYVAICKDEMLVPVDETKSDIIENLAITLPLLHRGVGGFTCKLPNMNAEYTGKISDFDHILIYLRRKGTDWKKVFGGKILLPGTEGFGTSQEYYLLISGMDIGQELLVPPSLMKKIYSATGGKTIIQDAVDLCNEMTKKFVDVDSEIASSHDFEFEEVKPHAVITQVCAQAKTLGGVVGFDGYVDPPGNLHVFKRGKYTSSIDLTGKIEHYKKEDDIHRVRNKIKVYGVAEKTNPSDKDSWTEGIENWTSNGTLSFDTTDRKLGSGSVKAVRAGATNIYVERTFSQVKCDTFHDYFKNLNLFIKWKHAGGEKPYSLHVELSDSSAKTTRYYGENLLHSKSDEWASVEELKLGRKYEHLWTKVAGERADWYDIVKIRLTLWWSSSSDVEIKVDGLHFGGARFFDQAEDATSQSKYGVRWEEPVVDEGLKSDNECLKKAESLRDFLKDKVTTLSDFKVEGDNGFTSGDRQLITIPNDNINDYFRILEIRHVISGVQWDTYLTLSNEPQMVDYVFADLHRELRRLSLSKGKSNPGGGVGGERYQAASRIICPVGYTGAPQWDHSDIQAAINDQPSPCPSYAKEKCDYYGPEGIQQAIDED